MDTEKNKSPFTFKEFVQGLEEYNIAKVRWLIYYESDEHHFEDDPTVTDIDGNNIEVSTMVSENGQYKLNYHPAFNTKPADFQGERMEGWKALLWDISEKFDLTGVFELDVRERKVSQVAEAYVPDSELETSDIDPVEFKFSLDDKDGVWDGPFYPSWSEQDKDSPYKVQFWNDPNGFNNSGWVPKTVDTTKASWIDFRDHRTILPAIRDAYCWHQNGQPYGATTYPKPGEKPIKGKTAARVINAWGEEIYVVSSKGVIHDKRAPFRIQIQGYRRTITPSPHGWVHLINGRPGDSSFPPGFKDEYKTMEEAEAMALAYVDLNVDKMHVHVRVADNKDREAVIVYTHVNSDYKLSHRDVRAYHLVDKPIERNQVLLELHANDLYSLAQEVRRRDQQEWASKFALRYYGEKARHIVVDTTFEYDDQSHYDETISDIEVRDENDDIMSYDPEAIQKIIAEAPDDLEVVVRNYLGFDDQEIDLHFVEGYTGDGTNYDVDKDIDFAAYNVANDHDFFEYVKDNILEDYIFEDRYDVDANGIAGDYYVGQIHTMDERWKYMRIFSLIDGPASN